MEPFHSTPLASDQDFKTKLPELEAYLVGHWLADFANFSAFVFHALPSLNWAGFYLFDGEKLKLGPFVGKPACTEIKVGRGVCGTAFAQKKALLVHDVEAFPGHIACDSASRSELVIPVFEGGECFGVLDLDSPALARFQESDQRGIELWLNALQIRLAHGLAAKKPWV